MEEAAMKNDVKKMRELARGDPKCVNSRGIWDWTPLMRAADHDKLEACTTLLEELKAEVDLSDEWDHTALHIAAVKGHEKIVKLLIKHGANVDYLDKMDRTPLMLASHNGHCETVRILIRNDASIDKKSKENMTALDMARRGGRRDMHNILLQVTNHGRKAVYERGECLKCSCAKCDSERKKIEEVIKRLRGDVNDLKEDKKDTNNKVDKLERELQQMKMQPGAPSKSDSLSIDIQAANANGAGSQSSLLSPTSSTTTVYPAQSETPSSHSSDGLSDSYGSNQHPIQGQGQMQQFVNLHGRQPSPGYFLPQQPQYAPIQCHAPASYYPQPLHVPMMAHGLPAYPAGHPQAYSPAHQQAAFQTHPQAALQAHPQAAMYVSSDPTPGMDQLPPQARVTTKILSVIANTIGNELMNFAIELGFEESDIETIRCAATKPSDAAMKILSKWEGRVPVGHPHPERFRQLFKALNKSDKNNIIEKVLEEAGKQVAHRS